MTMGRREFLGAVAGLAPLAMAGGAFAADKKADKSSGYRLVYLEVAATDSDVRGGEPVFVDEQCVGVTTSGGYGHHVQKSLAFAYVESNYVGSSVEFGIDLLGERCAASVLPAPVYDSKNVRLKS